MSKTVISMIIVIQSLLLNTAFGQVSGLNAGEINQSAQEMSVENNAQDGFWREVGVGLGIGILFGIALDYRGEVVCKAENARGMIFKNRGLGVRSAERRALDSCYSVSRHCRIISCYRVW